MKKQFRLLSAALLLLGAFTLASCGGDDPKDDGPVTVKVTGVSLDKTETTLVVGTTEQLTATVRPNDADNKNVTWSTSDANVATVNQSGLVTAVSDGTAAITAKTTDGSFSASCNVTVSTPNDYFKIEVNGVAMTELKLQYRKYSTTSETVDIIFSKDNTFQYINDATKISQITFPILRVTVPVAVGAYDVVLLDKNKEASKTQVNYYDKTVITSTTGQCFPEYAALSGTVNVTKYKTQKISGNFNLQVKDFYYNLSVFQDPIYIGVEKAPINIKCTFANLEVRYY